MNIRPLHDRVVVRRIAEERTSAGGILISDSATEKTIQEEEKAPACRGGVGDMDY